MKNTNLISQNSFGVIDEANNVEKAMNYIIQDWASNHLFQDKKFETYQDGWDFLMEQFPDDNDLQEYYVILTNF